MNAYSENTKSGRIGKGCIAKAFLRSLCRGSERHFLDGHSRVANFYVDCLFVVRYGVFSLTVFLTRKKQTNFKTISKDIGRD